jgi:HK97 family phage prohead protease
VLRKAFGLAEGQADGEGTFTAIVAVFGNVDRQGDRIVKGAFTKTLAQWEASGDPIPIILAHQWGTIESHIGVAWPQDVKQVAKGLLMKAQLDVADNEVAARVFKLLKRRSLKEFSIGYDIFPGGERRAADGAMELMEIDLFEAGPTLKGANPATELLEVKSALGVKDEESPLRRPRRPAPSSAALRERAEAVGLQLPWTERELRKASDAAVKEHVTVPSRALRRRSEEQQLAAAIGDTNLPPTEGQRRKRAERAEMGDLFAKEYGIMLRALLAQPV